jgi:hypothetical protein
MIPDPLAWKETRDTDAPREVDLRADPCGSLACSCYFQRRRCLPHDASEAPNLALRLALSVPSAGIMEAACSIDNANFARWPLEFRDPLAPRVGFDVPV